LAEKGGEEEKKKFADQCHPTPNPTDYKLIRALQDPILNVVSSSVTPVGRKKGGKGKKRGRNPS